MLTDHRTQLGHGNESGHPTPCMVKHLRDEGARVTQIACGSRHTVVLTDLGKVCSLILPYIFVLVVVGEGASSQSRYCLCLLFLLYTCEFVCSCMLGWDKTAGVEVGVTGLGVSPRKS